VLEVALMLAPAPPKSGNCGGLANVIDHDQKLPFAQLGFGFLAVPTFVLEVVQMLHLSPPEISILETSVF
jgi:hypothetical protein